MNTNIRTVSVHDTRVKQAIADLDEPTLRGAAAEYLGLELIVVA